MTLAEGVSTEPRVAVLVIESGGHGEHPAIALSSLADQTYPRARFDTLVVAESQRRLINAIVQDQQSEYVAFLASTARVDRGWVSALISTAGRHQAAAVASTILDPTGDRVEFAGRRVSITGHVTDSIGLEGTNRSLAEKRLLFASSVSAMYDRRSFVDAGGFDEDFLGCLDDIDLGWRLNLFGQAVLLAPEALTYHAVESPPQAAAQRIRLEERNALAMIFTNYSRDTCAKVLPAAIALSLFRGLEGSGVDGLDLRMSAQPPRVCEVRSELIAHLIALEDFYRDIDSLRAKRQLIQSRRCRTDAELVDFFGAPSADRGTAGSAAIEQILIETFGIDRVFTSTRTPPKAIETSRGGQAPAIESRQPTRQTHAVVSIVILTALGSTHLQECLASLRAQTYPADCIEVIIVDNGSAEDPTTAVGRWYAGAHVIRNTTNIGFAAGNNQGAGIARGKYLVFLNDDTRADPRWLTQLVDTAERRSAAAVASCILDWAGKRIDFVEGAVNFQGKGFQLHYDAAAETVALEEAPLLFACGAAMLIDRAVFLNAGGWDEGAFAYYEDVELGWRLNVLGHQVWFAPEAVIYHRHHGTSARWAEPPRTRLYERNSLRMLYQLLETESLERALPAALLLAGDRALLGTRVSRVHEDAPTGRWRRLVSSSKELLRAQGISRRTTVREAVARLGIPGLTEVVRAAWDSVPTDASRRRRATYRPGHREGPPAGNTTFETIPIQAAARLAGIHAFLSDLPVLARRRADIQGRRCQSDREVLRPFGAQWLTPSPAAPFQAEHDAVHSALVAEFQLADIVNSEE